MIRFAVSGQRLGRFQPGHSRLRVLIGTAVASLALASLAGVPSPEKLLPDDTLLLVTAPDLSTARQVWAQLPQSKLWSDPAVRAFKERLINKCNDEFVSPLERELKVTLSDYTGLLQGQFTFAVTRNGWEGGDSPLGVLLLVDTRAKSDQLKTTLTELRAAWTESGRTLRTEKIRNVEFAILSLTSNDVPKTLRKLIPKTQGAQESDDNAATKVSSPKSELVIGQVDSLLIVGNTIKPVEKIVARLTGGRLPALADVTAYQADYAAFFRNASAYAWIDVHTFVNTWLKKAAENKDDPAAPNPFDIKPQKIVTAAGITGVTTASATFRSAVDGEYFQAYLRVPEGGRRGLFKIFAGEPKDVSPPPFVPADAVKFQRWRIDGQKAWATLEKMLGEISPQSLSGINFLFQTANAAGKEKDPGFDIRKNLIGNLGDDFILYEKAPLNGSSSQNGPGLALIASPNPEQLALAVKSMFLFFGQQPGVAPEQREFLGRKIMSVALGNMALPLGSPAPSQVRTLHYAASGGYVAFSTDVSLLEEYLRNCDTQGKILREASGLADAMQKVAGPGCTWFGYENEVTTMKATIEALRKTVPNNNSPGGATAPAMPGAFGLAASGQGISDWFDFSLLPPFERISKYFSFSVYGGAATADGLSIKMYVPTPLGLQQAQAK